VCATLLLGNAWVRYLKALAVDNRIDTHLDVMFAGRRRWPALSCR